VVGVRGRAGEDGSAVGCALLAAVGGWEKGEAWGLAALGVPGLDCAGADVVRKARVDGMELSELFATGSAGSVVMVVPEAVAGSCGEAGLLGFSGGSLKENGGDGVRCGVDSPILVLLVGCDRSTVSASMQGMIWGELLWRLLTSTFGEPVFLI
jgi:hypothetical protein